MAEDKLGIDIGVNIDVKKFQQEISKVSNTVSKLSVEMSTLGDKARKSMEKYSRALQNMVAVGSGEQPSVKLTKKGKVDNRQRNPYRDYSKRALNVYTGEIQNMGTLLARINTALEPMVVNMGLAQQLANKTNSAFMTTENYQTLINDKVKNQLNSSIANKNAILKNIDLKKEEKDLQEQINKELKGAEDSTQRQTKKQVSLVTQLRRLFAGVYVIKRFASIFTDMVKLSGDWVENLNLFVVSFGQDFYKESLDWATDFSQRLGASVNEIVKLTANFRQLTSAIGYAQETSDSLSRTLTSLSYDLTSYYNLEDVETAYTKLSSGIFSGQVKTLRSLGIDVSAESITTYLKELSGTYSDFIGITNSGLDQSQKVLARTLLVMKSASNSFGDMSRSIETLANRQRVFIASLENLKLALGDLASDTLSTLLAYANGFIRAITTIIRVFKPLKEELDYDVGGTVLGALNEEAEETQKNLNKLSFDKFETLTGNGDSKGQLGITEALTAELEKQIALYNEQASQYEGIDKMAQSVYSSILKWAFPLSEINEETGELILNTEKYSDNFQNILNLSQTFTDMWNTIKPLMPALISVSGTLLDIVGNIITLLDKMDLLEGVIYAMIALNIASKIGTIISALSGLGVIISGIVAVMGVIFSPTGLIVMGVGLIIGVLIAFGEQIKWFFQQILKGISVLFFGAVSLMVNAIVSVINIIVIAINGILDVVNAIAWLFGGSVSKIPLMQGITLDMFMGMIPQFYDGGSLNLGTQVWGMNEKGNPEFMFNAGGYDSVINADILERAIANGTASAIVSSGLLDKASQSLVIKGQNIDDSAFARAIFPALQKESTRLGGNKL